jgi:hypothetical protein
VLDLVGSTTVRSHATDPGTRLGGSSRPDTSGENQKEKYIENFKKVVMLL